MANKLLFSVLIANYNNGKYLMDAVESVREQTYTNWEIILVDDSSTDNSHELYNELEKDERIHIFLNNQNRGCGYTKHRCAELANGEICGYLDPDDELLPNALYDSVHALLQNDKNILSLSRYYNCDENMNVLSESRLLELKGLSYFERRDYQPEVFAAFRLSAYKASLGIDSSLKAAIDQDLYFKLEEHGDIVVLDKFTYKYRQNPAALTSIPYWCTYWNILVRHNTCTRRGLPVEKFSYADFRDILAKKDNDLARIIKSKAYCLGRCLIAPLKKIISFLEFIKCKKFLS